MAVGKNLSWQFVLGKPMVVLGKTYFGSFRVGHHLVGLVVHHLVFFGKTRNLAGKKSFRKTHGWMGKTFVGSCIVRKTHGWLGKTYVWQLFIGKPMAILGKTYFGSFMVGNYLVLGIS